MSHDDLGLVAQAIKAIHAEGGQRLTREEAVEFLSRRFYLGPGLPPTPEPGRRGPKPKKTVYDLAYERRADLWRRLVLLPKSGEDASWLADDRYKTELLAVFEDKSIPRRAKATRLCDRLASKGLRQPAVRTVRRHLRALEGLTK